MKRLLSFCWRLAALSIFCFPALSNAQGNDIKIMANYHPVSKYLPPGDSVSHTGESRQVGLGLNSHFGLYTKMQ